MIAGSMWIIGRALVAWWQVWLLALAAAPTASIAALVLATFADNKVQVFAVSKFLGLAGFTIFGGWFVAEPVQWTLGLFPPFLVSKAYWMALDGQSSWWMVLVCGLVLQIALIGWLIRRFRYSMQGSGHTSRPDDRPRRTKTLQRERPAGRSSSMAGPLAGSTEFSFRRARDGWYTTKTRILSRKGSDMRQLDDRVWTRRAPMDFFGVSIHTRMTVVELPSEKLWIHSPIPIDDELRAWVDDRGPVAYVVAPNRFHHVFVDEWVEAFPEATLCGAPGLPEKRDDLEFDHVLVADGEPPWGDALDQQLLEGAPALNEVMFFHEPSRTLITADLLHNESDPDSWVQKVYLWLNGTLGEPGINRVIRWFVYKDRHAVRQSLERVLTWNFDRLIVSHGQVIEPRARETLRHVLEEEL